ncbi:MAG: SAM-dependent methyltransferase [candidate division Zixibacteria bacterium]|nr:SAM-dependent methyltransferase [candidate division Zixibacteria bacterium]
MIELEPIAFVKNSRSKPIDDYWGDIISQIVLEESFPEAMLEGIESFSHLEIIYYFHRADKTKTCREARHPRNNPNWPKVGILAQRGKNRPNRIGLTAVKLVNREGRVLTVAGLDAIDGTPVIDIKPVMKEFLPDGEVKQPSWVGELMRDYWRKDSH